MSLVFRPFRCVPYCKCLHSEDFIGSLARSTERLNIMNTLVLIAAVYTTGAIPF